jgi:ribosomal protein S18 acetylase RimI-like enzyme
VIDLALRRTTLADVPALFDLHRAAAEAPGGLARRPDEVDVGYVSAFVAKASASGVALSAWSGDRIAGEIHASRMGPRQFEHVLTDLTVAVHPGFQGQGVGRKLFQALIATAVTLTPAIERIELMAREGNLNAVGLYKSLGFEIEGRMPGRVRMADGTADADLAMCLRLP